MLLPWLRSFDAFGAKCTAAAAAGATRCKRVLTYGSGGDVNRIVVEWGSNSELQQSPSAKVSTFLAL